MTISETRIQQRRAIEALRSGVPNRDAVRALGSAQPKIEERFEQLLEAARAGFADGKQAAGLLVAGDFGSGKSHLLEYLQHLALEENFVCSKVVISKETPLHDPVKFARAAIEAAVVPGRRGSALTEIAAALNFNDDRCAGLVTYLNQGTSKLNSRFAATLFLYEREKEEEIRNRIISFWSGDPLGVGTLRSWLRSYGQAASYSLEKVSARDLALQRFKFVARLIVAAGYSGWVHLVDEIELIGRYSFHQRARSYAELARWAGKLEGETYPGLAAVFAITADFTTAVLEERNDLEAIPRRLGVGGPGIDTLLASQAERGMRLIARNAVRLQAPDRRSIEQTRGQIRQIHAQAYDWDPPALETEPQLSTTSMRQYVRRWINEWDLKRLDPGYIADTVVSDLGVDYQENPDFDTPGETDIDPGV